MVTSPALADAVPVATVKLRRRARGRGLRAGSSRITQLTVLIPPVFAISLPVTQLVSEQADVRRPTGEEARGAVLAGSLVTAVTAVVRAVAKEM